MLSSVTHKDSQSTGRRKKVRKILLLMSSSDHLLLQALSVSECYTLGCCVQSPITTHFTAGSNDFFAMYAPTQPLFGSFTDSLELLLRGAQGSQHPYHWEPAEDTRPGTLGLLHQDVHFDIPRKLGLLESYFREKAIKLGQL